MKKSTILKSLGIVLFAILVSSNLSAQVSPASVSAESSTLYKHGTNAGGVSAYENIDSLTTGAANVKYFVFPDSAISPSYSVATPDQNLNSTFAWSTSPSAGVTIVNTGITGFLTNYARISFPTPGTLPADYTISVIETATVTSCSGAARAINVRLIAAPTVTGGTVTAPGCPSANTPYDISVPNITLTGLSSAVSASNQQIRITYTLQGPTNNAGAIGTLGSGTINLAEGSSVVDLSTLGAIVDYPGTYTFSVTGISDRISRKSNVTVTPTFTNVTFVVNRRPVTGPIYHIPNI